jgi:hypothetical protein
MVDDLGEVDAGEGLCESFEDDGVGEGVADACAREDEDAAA